MQLNNVLNNLISAHESGDIFIVKLTQGKECYIDKEDIGLIQQYKWHYRKDKINEGYAVHAYFDKITKSPKSIKLHRLLIGATKSQKVDHINGNKLDNRKSNIRIATSSENGINRPKFRKDSTSIYKGVYFHKWKKYKNWRASIRLNNKLISIGYFQEEKEAGIAYNKKAIELFGNFAYINEIKL